MAASCILYGHFLLKALNKEILLSSQSSNLKIMLCNENYIPDKAAHIYKSSVVPFEITGDGYTSGGIALSNVTVNYNTLNHTIKINANNVQWMSTSVEARYAVIYDNTGSTDSQKILMCYVDFGQNISTYRGNFLIQWDVVNGISTISI